MFARPTLALLALTVSLPMAASAQGGGGGFEYTPSTGQYRVTTSSKGTQEVMGQKQEAEQSQMQLITVTLTRPVKDTMTMSVVVDSLNLVGPMGMTPPGMDKLVGLKVGAKLSPAGVFYSAEVPKDSVSMPMQAQMMEGLNNFLPRLRGKMTAGSAWTDTTTGKVSQNAFEIERKIISKFTVLGDTTVRGEKAWKVGHETTTTLSGSGAPQGQPASMEGTSNGKGTIVVSQKGVFLGSNRQDQANIKVVLSGNGMEVNIVQDVTTKIEKVK